MSPSLPPENAEVEKVQSFWQGLELPGIIDVHTHFMPKSVMDKVWKYFDDAGPLTGMPWPITYREDEETRLNLLRAFGVRAFTSMVYPHKPGMAAWLNAWSADFASRTPDVLHTSTFYPEPSAPAYVQAAVESGSKIFKSHVQVGSYAPNDPMLDGVWSILQDAGSPIVIHCGSGPAPGTYTGPEPISALLQRFPGLRLIIAHMGMTEYHEFLDIADRFSGVLLDTTMAFTSFTEERWPFPVADLPRLRELQGRILFGSDYPNIPHPYLEALQAVRRLDFGDDWVRDVCYFNAARLFGLRP